VAEIADQIRREIEDLEAFIDLGDLEVESAAYVKRRAEVKQGLGDMIALHKKLTQLSDRLSDVPLSNKKGRRRAKGKLARVWVELSRAIRKIPFYASQWKQFAKEIERVVEELSHFERD